MNHLHRGQHSQVIAATERRLMDLIESTESLLNELRSERGALADDLRARATITVRDARSRLQAMHPSRSIYARAALKRTGRFVRTDPWRTVAIGALALVALGVLLSRWER